MPRGDPDAWATQVLHIICPCLHPGEDTSASPPHSVDTTSEAAVTSSSEDDDEDDNDENKNKSTPKLDTSNMHIDSEDIEPACHDKMVSNLYSLSKINNLQNELCDNHSNDGTNCVAHHSEHKIPEVGHMANLENIVDNLKVKMEILNENKFGIIANSQSLNQSYTPPHIKMEKETTDAKTEKASSDYFVKKKIKKQLKEANDIRVHKFRNKTRESECKQISCSNIENKRKRPETPPLQKLMRQDFSPLISDASSPPLPKKFKNDSSSKGFTSKLASVIIPSVSLPAKAASHPKQLFSFSMEYLQNSSLKTSNFSKSSYSSSTYALKQIPVTQSLCQVSTIDDQPLDLSVSARSTLNNSFQSYLNNSLSDIKRKDNGHSSTSLQSLQQRFGGDFHLRGLRKPLNYMLYGPEIPMLHQALLHSASLALPLCPLPVSNGVIKRDQRCRNSTPSPHKLIHEEPSKSLKTDDSFSENSIKHEQIEKSENENVAVPGEDRQGENYTNHLCTCGKWFDGLYSLSLHLQETGHLPARDKSVSLLEYPKLVRGQDMWLNQESEQTRRILRCIQCGESFKTLPMLTVHMMKTQHYTKIVSSEHTRRSHKCSTYCDKEQDKNCVFKCKVCQDSFSDMEGLANHMILSGHHNNQSTHPSHSFRNLHIKHRKRYSFEESFNPYRHPNVAAMLHEYRKESISEQDSQDMFSDDLDDNKMCCENCGMRIEMKLLVSHVRICLGQKLREVSRMEKENIVKEEKLNEDNHRVIDELMKKLNGRTSPCKKKMVEMIPNKGESISETNDSVKCELKNEYIDDINTESNMESNAECGKTNIKVTKHSLNELVQPDNDNEFSKNILKEIQTLVDSKKLSMLKTSTKPSGIFPEIKNDICESSSKVEENETTLSKKLDIIDPENVKEDSCTGSALSAMESFINTSFSNKFDHKKGNIIINSQVDATNHSRPLSSVFNFESTNYLDRYKNFYESLNVNNDFKHGSVNIDKEKSGQKSRRTDEDIPRSKLEVVKCENEERSPFLEDKDDCSVKSIHSDSSSILDGKINLETKYLNIEEVESSKSDNGKSSALDNLSSFVYGQTLTSEHPLDSLQRLITKSDIPKIMSSDCMRGFQYLPPHLQLHQSNSDLTVPLKLSVKSQHGNSDDEDSKSRLDDETGSFSDCDTVASPMNSDGEPLEYRCAACSRRFASKGSYRYHLSRCHLSSVKRYGIKEAFNMSPYVYLPLDHTAKFSKYYEMAKELANRGKGNRTK